MPFMDCNLHGGKISDQEMHGFVGSKLQENSYFQRGK